MLLKFMMGTRREWRNSNKTKIPCKIALNRYFDKYMPPRPLKDSHPSSLCVDGPKTVAYCVAFQDHPCIPDAGEVMRHWRTLRSKDELEF
jgi:hypothetical protein